CGPAGGRASNGTALLRCGCRHRPAPLQYPDPAADAARQPAQPALAGRRHVPVLRQGDALVTALRRPRGPHLAGRSGQQLGEPGDRVPALQREEGKPLAQRGRHAAHPPAGGGDPGIRPPDLPALSPAQARLRPAALERPGRRLSNAAIFSPLFHAGAGPPIFSRFFTPERGPYFLPAFSRRSGAPLKGLASATDYPMCPFACWALPGIQTRPAAFAEVPSLAMPGPASR